MQRIKRVLVAIAGVISALFLSLFTLQKRKVEKQKDEIEELKGLEQVRQTQMETLKEVQDEIRQAMHGTPEPERVESPSAGDSASRLDRLNRLHEL